MAYLCIQSVQYRSVFVSLADMRDLVLCSSRNSFSLLLILLEADQSEAWEHKELYSHWAFKLQSLWPDSVCVKNNFQPNYSLFEAELQCLYWQYWIYSSGSRSGKNFLSLLLEILTKWSSIRRKLGRSIAKRSLNWEMKLHEARNAEINILLTFCTLEWCESSNVFTDLINNPTKICKLYKH